MSEQVPEGSGPGRFSLEDLIALNDEIAALARAGMPLERGLLDLGRDVPGRLGAMTTALGERMSRGEGLAEAIAAQGDRLPPMYRAVVEAGIRSGRLPVALEGLAGVARRVVETRRVGGAGAGLSAARALAGLRALPGDRHPARAEVAGHLRRPSGCRSGAR